MYCEYTIHARPGNIFPNLTRVTGDVVVESSGSPGFNCSPLQDLQDEGVIKGNLICNGTYDNPKSSLSTGATIGIGIGAGVGGILLIAILVGLCICISRQKKTSKAAVVALPNGSQQVRQHGPQEIDSTQGKSRSAGMEIDGYERRDLVAFLGRRRWQTWAWLR